MRTTAVRRTSISACQIVSGNDDVPVPGTQERWIDIKRGTYLAHEPCEALLIVQQGRIDAQVDIKTESGWKSAKSSGLSPELNVPRSASSAASRNCTRARPISPAPSGSIDRNEI